MSRCLGCSLFLSLLVTPALWGEKPTHLDRYGDPLPAGAVARIGSARFPDRGSASAAVAYAPDGKLLAFVDNLGNIKLVNGKDGKVLRSFGGKRPQGQLDLATNWPYASWQAFAFFSPDGKKLLTGSDHWPISLWDVSTGKELAVMEHSKGGVLGLAVAPDFKTVAAAGKTQRPHLILDGRISLWDVSSGKLLRRWQSKGEKVWALAWSPDGKTLASGDDDKCVRFWDPHTGKPKSKLAGFGSDVVGVAYAPDGKTLATADMDRNLALWDVRAGCKRVRQWAVEVPPDSNSAGGRPSLGAIMFTPDGKRLLTRDVLNECPVDVWHVPSGRRLWQFQVAGGPTSICCAVSPDGGTLATVQPGCFYDLGTGKQLLESPGWYVTDLHFLPGGQALVTNEKDLWDAATGRKLRRLNRRMPGAVSPDGEYFAEWGEKAISLRHLATGKEVRALPTGSVGSCWPLTFSPDSRTLAAFGNGPHERRHLTIRFWDVASGKELKSIDLSACPRHLNGVVFSPDGRLVASLGDATFVHDKRGAKAEEPAGPCYLWNRASRRLLHTIDLGPAETGFARTIAFSPDGRVLMSVGDNGCQLWEVVTGKRMRWLTRRWATAAAFAADGRSLAWAESKPAGGKHVIHLTDLATGKEYHRQSGHTRTISALAFAADGKRLASGAEDATALVWDLSALPSPEKLRPLTLTDKQLQSLWVNLGSADPVRAHAALWTLMRGPKEAIAFLDARRQEWASKAQQDGKRVVRLLADVDSDVFKVRDAATSALLAFGPKALPLIVKQLRDGKMSLDARRRLEKVRDALEAGTEGVSLGSLAMYRATELLERLGTPDARRVLERLAEEAGPVAEQAQASLRRLKR